MSWFVGGAALLVFAAFTVIMILIVVRAPRPPVNRGGQSVPRSRSRVE
jgi:hypothetical protein